jgi:hypothetical protein
MVASALALDEGLDADLERAYASAPAVMEGRGREGVFHAECHHREQRTDGADLSDPRRRYGIALAGRFRRYWCGHAATIAAGFVSTIVVGLMSLARRGQLRQGWILALTPIYWACLSIAAWRALYQLLSEPYKWEKTEHGLSPQSDQPPLRGRPSPATRRRNGGSATDNA